jgi:hypothetical protein
MLWMDALQVEPRCRIGFAGVESHPWLADVDWAGVVTGSASAPPFDPRVTEFCKELTEEEDTAFAGF